MSEELKKLGGVLREKREERNLSLKEIENETSIRSSYLAAIEEGTIMDQISGVYAQGFVKQYASFLGVESHRFLRDHPTSFRFPGEKQEFAYGIGSLEIRGSQGAGVKWFPLLLWCGCSVVVLLIAWYLAKSFEVL